MTAQRNPSRTLLVTFMGVTAVSLGSFVNPSYQVRYNASRSAPLGWYAVIPERHMRVGDFALARLPIAAAVLADQRDYLPKSVPILKRITAMDGQIVCALADGIAVDGVLIARTLAHDSAGRALDHWTGCRRLAVDELFLLNPDSAASFDSRYFGPIHRFQVVGKAIPLWTW